MPVEGVTGRPGATLSTILGAEPLPSVVVPLTTGTSVRVATFLRRDVRVADPVDRTSSCWAPNKPTLRFDGQKTWAEFVVVRLLERAGWAAVWVKNWAGGREFCRDVDRRRDLPAQTQRLFGRIHKRAEQLRGAGTWDVLAWKGEDHLFIESKKHRSGDKLRPNQISFLEAATAEGLRPNQFAIVEYEAIL